MSTIVQPRREAASYVSTHAGAPREYVVDTTNQRGTIHDGATLGGFPQAAIADLPGRNAIVNGNFAINQRAYASGGSLAAGAYAHDRWKAGTAGAYTFMQGAADTAISITSGTLVQAVDTGNVYAASMWLTWQGTATARVWQGSASGSFSAGTSVKVGGITVNALLVTGLTVGSVANIEFGTGTLGLVQLEAALPNAGPTRFERRHGELALCQRYFWVASDQDNIGNVAVTSAVVCAGFVLPVTMRAVPSIALTSGTFYISDGYSADFDTSNPGIYATGGTAKSARVGLNGFSGMTTGRFMSISGTSGTLRIYFRAEL